MKDISAFYNEKFTGAGSNGYSEKSTQVRFDALAGKVFEMDFSARDEIQVLDWGCGPGRLLGWMIQNLEKCPVPGAVSSTFSYLGIDVREECEEHVRGEAEAIKETPQTAISSASFATLEAFDEFQDHPYDVVFGVGLLCHSTFDEHVSLLGRLLLASRRYVAFSMLRAEFDGPTTEGIVRYTAREMDILIAEAWGIVKCYREARTQVPLLPEVPRYQLDNQTFGHESLFVIDLDCPTWDGDGKPRNFWSAWNPPQ